MGELLQIKRVGRRDNFFSLGGHSLQAARVVTRIRERLGVAMAAGDLFAHPVLADLAISLNGAARAELPPIVRVERGNGCHYHSPSNACSFWRRWKRRAGHITCPGACICGASWTQQLCGERWTGLWRGMRLCGPLLSCLTESLCSALPPPRSAGFIWWSAICAGIGTRRRN